jgi:hypothetical protein
MDYQTFHEGSHSDTPLALMAQRESLHCEKIGVPFLHVENERGHSIWAYLWPSENVSEREKARIGDWAADHYVLLVAQHKFHGTVTRKLLAYRGDFKEWARKLRYSALHWQYFPDEEFALP